MSAAPAPHVLSTPSASETQEARRARHWLDRMFDWLAGPPLPPTEPDHDALVRTATDPRDIYLA